MPRSYPHMSDADNFPYVDQVDVWKYENNFDYSQFDDVQMRITVCTVPWDVGLIHVGNAQIGGLGNVVAFADENTRDAYIESIDDKYVFSTEYRKFYVGDSSGGIDGRARIPVPVEASTRFNYLMVEYEELPVALEHYGTRKFFFFIREPRRIATNTTEVDLLLDTWQTFMPGVKIKIPYMMLERGHAPMAALGAEEFLENPLENSRYVAGNDVNFGLEAGAKVAYENNIIFNDGDSVFACFVCDSNVIGEWGEFRDTWRMPSTHALTIQGVPDAMCIALDARRMAEFLAAVDESIPQFKQCVRAVFFATEKLVSITSTFALAGFQFGIVAAASKTFSGLVDLDVEKFDYPEEYAHIAKLYTWPYAHIEIIKDDGTLDIIRVEDTTGRIDIEASLSLAYPFLHLTANALGIGGEARSVKFKNATDRSIKIGGAWQRVKLDWDVPTFAVLQDYDTYYDYSAFFEREQAREDANTAFANATDSAQAAYDNALASNSAAYGNALASAQAAYDNSVASANTSKTNADNTADTSHTNAYNSANTTQANTKIMADAAKTNADADADTIVSNAELDAVANDANVANRSEYNSTSAALTNAFNTRTNNIANGFINASTSTQVAAEKENSVISAVGSAAGAALSGSPSGLADAVLNYMQAGVTINATQEQAANQIAQNNSGLASTQLNTAASNAMATGQMGLDRNVENSRIRGQAANTAGTAKANATRTRNANYTTADNSAATDKGNADNTVNMEKVNSTNARDTSVANAARTKNAADANAARSKNAADSNALRTKANADEVAQRNLDNAYLSILNAWKDAALEPSKQFGNVANAQTATTRPQGIFAQIVTQTPGEIAAAGDEMLRFGYTCSMQWAFNGWNLMPKFTYWKCADIWIDGLSIPDKYADGIRFALMGGVCVWRDPNDIGKTSIYDNWR